MSVDEALELVAGLERDGRYDAWMAAHVLADEVRRLQPIEERATELVEFDGRGVNPKSDAALYILGARRTP